MKNETSPQSDATLVDPIDLATLPPLFDFAEAKAVEAGEAGRGQLRRTLLAIGSKSGAELIAAVRESAPDSPAFIEIMEAAADWLEWRKREDEVLAACLARLTTALSIVADELEQAEGQP